MMKSSGIFTILTLSLYGLKDTIAEPIITTNAPPPTSILNSKPDSEDPISDFRGRAKEESLTPISNGSDIIANRENSLVQDDIRLKTDDRSDTLHNKPQPISISYDDIDKNMIADLFEDQSILDDYDFTSYQNSLNELINGTQLIPMQLSTWKSNIDNLVYSDSEIEPLDYHIEGLNNARTKNNKTNKSNYNPSEWDVFFNSIYFTWMKIIFILIIFGITLKDFIKARRSRKPKRPSSYRKSKYRRRS